MHLPHICCNSTHCRADPQMLWQWGLRHPSSVGLHAQPMLCQAHTSGPGCLVASGHTSEPTDGHLLDMTSSSALSCSQAWQASCCRGPALVSAHRCSPRNLHKLCLLCSATPSRYSRLMAGCCCRAGLYKQLAELKNLLAEFREAPARNSALRKPIIQTLNASGEHPVESKLWDGRHV